MKKIATRRWQEAQSAEQRYWQGAVGDGAELGRLFGEKIEAAAFAMKAAPDLAELRGRFLEIGIGPLGIGCIHFFRRAAEAERVGLDPLPPLAAEALPPPLRALAESCRRNYRQIIASGENSGLPDAAFDLVACYNVLDHCHDPAAILSESSRLLKPGGYFLLGCDTVSLLSRLRRQLFDRFWQRHSIRILAHPHQFSAAALRRRLREVGLTPLADNRRPAEALWAVIGRAHRLLLLAKKG